MSDAETLDHVWDDMQRAYARSHLKLHNGVREAGTVLSTAESHLQASRKLLELWDQVALIARATGADTKTADIAREQLMRLVRESGSDHEVTT